MRLSFLLYLSGALARTFTVRNGCKFTIWPAIFTDLNVAPNAPKHATGWKAKPGSSVSFYVPDNWKAGRIWGRSFCNFTTDPGPNSCLTGGCNGGLECDPRSGTGVPPATVAEWTLEAAGNRDFYDGKLLSKYRTYRSGCPVADCPKNLNPSCPCPLRGPYDSAGNPVGCKSACFANLDGNQGDSPNCCSGNHSTPETCPPSGVQYYKYFKSRCPNAYAYAYDESSETALWTCDAALKADYTLTFCPEVADVFCGWDLDMNLF